MRKILERCFAALLLLGLLAVPAVVVLWSHSTTTAYYENRTLAAVPALTWESLWDGSFGADFETWLSDHMPGRTTLLMKDTEVQMDVLKRPNVSKVVVNADGVLLPFYDYPAAPKNFEPQAEKMTARFAHLSAHIVENGGEFLFVGLPEQGTFYNDCYPEDLYDRKEEMQVADDTFFRYLSDKDVSSLDMRTVFDPLPHDPAAEKPLYSRIDHHYTFYGAYVSYRAILDRLNKNGWDLPVLEEDDLEFRVLPNPYIGSRSRKLYQQWEGGEQPVIGIQKDPVPYTRTDNGQPSQTPLFITYEDQDQPTTYNLYMGGDFGETILETNRPELPNALIFGDSFTNAMEPLLYTAFNETRTLDLRHYQGDKSLADYISDYQPDIVLCIMNDTFYYTPTGNGAVWPD